MKEKIILASNNTHKLIEFKSLLCSKFDIISLKDAEISIEIEENGSSFEENALIKATKIYELTGIPTLADDSGLVVPSLDDKPGIYSARFAGPNATDLENRHKLLELMKHHKNREAYFVCSIVYMDENGSRFFEGKLYGFIAAEESGSNGFGYDPLFIPIGHDLTLGHISSDIKNTISHRAKASELLKISLLGPNKK